MIESVFLPSYKITPGRNSTEFEQFKNVLPLILQQELVDLTIKKVEIYRVGSNTLYGAASSNRLIIFTNATTYNATKITFNNKQNINGIETDFTEFFEPSNRGDLLIISPEGLPLAEWFDKENELYILFDVLDAYKEKKLEIFRYIMHQFNELVWKRKIQEYSWVNTNNKEKLIKLIEEKIKNQIDYNIRNEKEQINKLEYDLGELRRKLKRDYDLLASKRRHVEMESNNSKNITEILLKDLDLIVQHEKIKDVHIIDNKFHIFTKRLNIHDDKGREFVGGEYKIIINNINSNIHFYSDNPRLSYWSNQDPHPHISGTSHEACFGSVSDTIAELCSQMQLYPLVTILIDFLESTYTGDIAGKNITNWDEIIDNKIYTATERNADENNEGMVECEECGCIYHIDELQQVYCDISTDGEPCGPVMVCRFCLENCFEWHDEMDAFIHQEALQDYLEGIC